MIWPKAVCSPILLVLLLTAASIFISACSAGAGSEAPMAAPAIEAEHVAGAAQGDMAWGDTIAMEPQEFGTWAYGGPAETIFTDRMVVRDAFLSMQTDRFLQTASEVERIVALYGGFIESSNHQLVTWAAGEAYWHADYILRVPVAYFDMVNRDIMMLGEVTSFSTGSEDVTMQFQDIASRVRIREEEERRILAMIDSTDNLEELIRLEARLSDLRLIMERYRRRMTEIDHLASFSAIVLNLSEVREDSGIAPADISFTMRMAAGFQGSVNFSIALLEGIAMLVAIVALPLAILSLPALGGLLVIRKLRATSVRD